MAAPSDKIRPMTPTEQRAKGIKYSPTAPAGSPSAMTKNAKGEWVDMETPDQVSAAREKADKHSTDRLEVMQAGFNNRSNARSGAHSRLFGEKGEQLGSMSKIGGRKTLTEDELNESGSVDFNDKRRHSREEPTYSKGAAKGLTQHQALARLERKPGDTPSPQDNFERRKSTGMPINEAEETAAKKFAAERGLDFDRDKGYVARGSAQPSSVQPASQPTPSIPQSSPKTFADRGTPQSYTAINSSPAIANTELPTVANSPARRKKKGGRKSQIGAVKPSSIPVPSAETTSETTTMPTTGSQSSITNPAQKPQSGSVYRAKQVKDEAYDAGKDYDKTFSPAYRKMANAEVFGVNPLAAFGAISKDKYASMADGKYSNVSSKIPTGGNPNSRPQPTVNPGERMTGTPSAPRQTRGALTVGTTNPNLRPQPAVNPVARMAGIPSAPRQARGPVQPLFPPGVTNPRGKLKPTDLAKTK